MTEIKSQLSINQGRLIDIVGSAMYSRDIWDVAAKELLQNAYDSIKGASYLSGKPLEDYHVSISFDEDGNMAVSDDGLGMSLETVQKAFFTLGGTDKGDLPESLRSGGLGMAKMAFMLSSDKFHLRTVKDGILITVDTTQDEIRNGSFIIRQEESKEENGTTVSIHIPREYMDKNERVRTRNFGIPDFLHQPSLMTVDAHGAYYRGPKDLFRLNGEPQLLGSCRAAYGEIDIYTRTGHGYIHVLSSGLYQFSDSLRGTGMEVIIDVKSNVGAENDLYPFLSSREGFKSTFSREFEDLKELARRLMAYDKLMETRGAMSGMYCLPETVGIQKKGIYSKTAWDASRNDFLQIMKTIMSGETTLKDAPSVPDVLPIDQSNLDINKPLVYLPEAVKLDKAFIPLLEKTAKLAIQVRTVIDEAPDDSPLREIRDSLQGQYFGASCEKDSYGININPKLIKAIMVNPLIPKWCATHREVVEMMVETFIHEITHNFELGHGDDFTIKFHKVATLIRCSEEYEIILGIIRNFVEEHYPYMVAYTLNDTSMLPFDWDAFEAERGTEEFPQD